jgi:hypothetical protein
MTEYYKSVGIETTNLTLGGHAFDKEFDLASEVGSLYAAEIKAFRYVVTRHDLMATEGRYQFRVNMSVFNVASSGTMGRMANREIVPWSEQACQVHLPEQSTGVVSGGAGGIKIFGDIIEPPMKVIIPWDKMYFNFHISCPANTGEFDIQLDLLYDVRKRSSNDLVAAQFLFGQAA